MSNAEAFAYTIVSVVCGGSFLLLGCSFAEDTEWLRELLVISFLTTGIVLYARFPGFRAVVNYLLLLMLTIWVIEEIAKKRDK